MARSMNNICLVKGFIGACFNVFYIFDHIFLADITTAQNESTDVLCSVGRNCRTKPLQKYRLRRSQRHHVLEKKYEP